MQYSFSAIKFLWSKYLHLDRWVNYIWMIELKWWFSREISKLAANEFALLLQVISQQTGLHDLYEHYVTLREAEMDEIISSA